MKIISWKDVEHKAIKELKNMIITIGVFDGMHTGHLKIFEKMDLIKQNGSKCVVTFRVNPKKMLRPESYHGCIQTLSQRLDFFQGLGIDLCVLIDFSADFSKISGKKFLSAIIDGLKPCNAVIGYDFHCGYDLSMNSIEVARFFSEAGIKTEIEEMLIQDGQAVSSSRIRKAIAEGRLSEAEKLLKRPYELDLRSVRKKFFFNKVQVIKLEQVLPPGGFYDICEIFEGYENPSKIRVVKNHITFRKTYDNVPDFLRFSNSSR